MRNCGEHNYNCESVERISILVSVVGTITLVKGFDLHPEEDWFSGISRGTSQARTYGLNNRTA